MRWSQLFIPTLRQDPTGVESNSHRLLLRAGYIQQIGSGIYCLLPLAARVRLKIMAIIREELDKIGAQECLLSVLSPAEIWQKSGRYETVGDIMFRLKDRKDSELVLGVTHEEPFTYIAHRHINSYKQLPQIWYQFQTKFRDELRPRGGLLRVREFTMKDSYSFDINEEGLDRSYIEHRKAYDKIFARCGLDVTIAEASSGIMGGAQSAEFLLVNSCGEDRLIVCGSCHYTANLEKARSKVPDSSNGDQVQELEKFATPNIRTIQELASFDGGTDACNQIKTLVYKAKEKKLIVLLRGDHELNLTALAEVAGDEQVEPCLEEEIYALLGAHPGSLGAVKLKNVKAQVIADNALNGRVNMQTGANQDDYHYRNVSLQRDIEVESWHDLRVTQEGDLCPNCGAELKIENALEVGHIFKLGTRYSEKLEAYALKDDGSKVPVYMGSYGIGVERLLAAVVENSHDAKGIIWPAAISPYQVLITPVNSKDSAMVEAAEKIYQELLELGLEVLLDDRQVRAGVKFNDGDLIGIPVRITVGRKISSNIVEVFKRSSGETTEVSLEQVKDILLSEESFAF